MDSQIQNLTPHSVLVFVSDSEGAVVGFTGVGPAAKEGKFTLLAEYKPEGPVARAKQSDVLVGAVEINGHSVPKIKTEFGSTTDLPEPVEGVLIFVSIVTAQAAKAAGRDTSDLLVTSDPVRDAAGKILGCRKFAIV